MTVSPPAILPALEKVAIIGAGGASGLVQLKQLLDRGFKPEQIVGFEGRHTVGGQWIYDKDPGQAIVDYRPNGQGVVRTKEEKEGLAKIPPTAMYEKMRTNLPKDVMAFRGFPFPEEVSDFPKHQEVQAYLNAYATSFDLKSLIRFNTVVTRVHKPTPSSKWTVKSTSSLTGETHADEFTHVVTCNGHYSDPWLPTLPGLWAWKGEVLHSRWWRNPSAYKGKKVLVIGSRASGSDVARELAYLNISDPTGPQTTIFQAARASDKPMYPEGLEWTKEITQVAECVGACAPTDGAVNGKLLLKDGKELTDVDVVVLCTGYLFTYPFFHTTDQPFSQHPVTQHSPPSPPVHPSPPPEVVDESIPSPGSHVVLNLDPSQIFYSPDPTLAFIGLAIQVAPFVLCEVQARAIAFFWDKGEVPELPALEQSSDKAANPHYIGYPAEANNADSLLRSIGEGVEGGKGWGPTTEIWKTRRVDAPRLRREYLGY